MQTVVTVAGSDSGAGAGIQADLKTISANGAYALTILTSVTAQNSRGVHAALALPADLIEAQFTAVFEDFSPGATKTGMLADEATLRCVARCLERHRAPILVVDPVMVSKSGSRLLAPEAIEALRRTLLPMADIVTPNLHEAGLLAGMTVERVEEMREAGRRILALGPRAVLLKGGRLRERPALDILFQADGRERHFPGEHIETRHTHGSGCTHSAALATLLGRGHALEDAIEAAKRYVTEAIRHGLPLGAAAGPTDHFYFLPGR